MTTRHILCHHSLCHSTTALQDHVAYRKAVGSTTRFCGTLELVPLLWCRETHWSLGRRGHLFVCTVYGVGVRCVCPPPSAARVRLTRLSVLCVVRVYPYSSNPFFSLAYVTPPPSRADAITLQVRLGWIPPELIVLEPLPSELWGLIMHCIPLLQIKGPRI
jgi:hypothetical protein